LLGRAPNSKLVKSLTNDLRIRFALWVGSTPLQKNNPKVLRINEFPQYLAALIRGLIGV